MTMTITNEAWTDRCIACGGTRLAAPHEWATDGDFMSREHTEPWVGGLTLCGDLHQFVQVERDICGVCDADNGPIPPGGGYGPGRMGHDCGQCGGN